MKYKSEVEEILKTLNSVRKFDSEFADTFSEEEIRYMLHDTSLPILEELLIQLDSNDYKHWSAIIRKLIQNRN